MNFKFSILFIFASILFMGCEEKVWNDHYHDQPETVDQNMWEAIQGDLQFSVYTGLIKEFNYDSLFLGDDPYTLFVPTNEALNELLDTGNVTRNILDYQISRHFIQSMNVSGNQKIQTLGEKFALFEKAGDGARLDGIPLQFESPLYRNGKYFTMESVALPRPNLYEFFAVNNPVLRDYIDSQDSVILDKELSRPTGFDEYGNTIYDTVSLTFNLFEEEFFPV
ncbi:MAG: fasciclin domain-containing protein, partial [Bacteroidales bacterium]|nr:fasciclin domain-containing protein [Bacteroidales bacterium]